MVHHCSFLDRSYEKHMNLVTDELVATALQAHAGQ